jgi:hypothetical protein
MPAMRAGLGWAAAGAALALLAACSGASPGMKPSTAENAASAASAAEAAGPATPAGPALAGAAASAYAAGLEAFKNGDLDGASQQFTRALQSDPRAVSGSRGARRRAGAARERWRVRLESTARADDCAGFWSCDSGQGALAPGAGPRRRRQRRSRAASPRSFPRAPRSLAAQAEVASVRGDSPRRRALAQKALKKDQTIARDGHARARITSVPGASTWRCTR